MMIKLLSIWAELFTYILLLKRISGKKIDRFSLVFIFMEGLLSLGLSHSILQNMGTGLVYALLLLYIFIDNHGISIKIILETLFAFIIISLIQLGMILLLSNIPYSDVRNAVASLLCLLISILLTRFVNLEKIKNHIVNSSHIIMYCTMETGCLCLFLILLFKLSVEIPLLVYLALTILLIQTTIFFLQWKKERDAHARITQFIKLQKIYNESFDKLITDVRSRQHEYNNQITALLSLHYTCHTYEELVEEQNKYCRQLVRENQFNSLLQNNSNPMLTGFLYYKLSAMASQNIQITHQIQAIPLEDPEKAMDLLEMIGILLNNAMEAVDLSPAEDYSVFVSLLREDTTLKISVKNTYPYIPDAELKRLVKKGYSQKGEQRGLGLYNVGRLATKYKGVYYIGNENNKGRNWFSVSITLKDWLKPVP